MIGAFANGLLITFLPVLLLPVLGAVDLPIPRSRTLTLALSGSCWVTGALPVAACHHRPCCGVVRTAGGVQRVR